MRQARKQTLITFETTPTASESNLPSGKGIAIFVRPTRTLAIFYLQCRIVATTNQTLDLDVQFVPTGPFQI